jgi:hypothetical protein
MWTEFKSCLSAEKIEIVWPERGVWRMTTMDLSSLSAALSKIDLVGDAIDDHVMRIIAEMAQAAEVGQDTFSYKLAGITAVVRIGIVERLAIYFPDLSVGLVGDTLLVDWS